MTENNKAAVLETLDNVNNATIELSLLPDLLQALLDDLHLDRADFTAAEDQNLIKGRQKIYSALTLTQLTIRNTLANIEALRH